MEKERPKIYRLDDNISFRKCTLYHNDSPYGSGDCTCHIIRDGFDEPFYHCPQEGIHFHCTKHPEIEMEIESRPFGIGLKCIKCDKIISFDSIYVVTQKCMRLLNMEKFKDAELIRLDDWYIPELKQKVPIKESDYWIHVDVKTDKDKDTIIVLYVGKKGSKEKTQFFIKPEKLQLSNDHKDLDPASILAKIEVTLKDRKIKQEYDEEN